MGLGSILSGVGAVAGLLGGGKGKVESAPQSGYATYPQWLKDLYEKTFAPAVTKQFEKEYSAIPMQRYDSVDPIFGSQQLLNFQRMSDAKGGQFSPYTDPNAPVTQAPAPVDDGTKAAEMADMEARMLARQMLSQADPGMKVSNVGGIDIGGRLAQQYGAGLYDDKSLADIGKYFMETQKKGQLGNQSGEGFDAYLQAINVQPQLEAMRRKGMA